MTRAVLIAKCPASLLDPGDSEPDCNSEARIIIPIKNSAAKSDRTAPKANAKVKPTESKTTLTPKYQERSVPEGQ